MKSIKNGLRRTVACAAMASALLAACGGSGDQVTTFHASRVLAFGDESSVINADGTKYSINGFTAGTTVIDCSVNPLWVQIAAAAYGLVFPDCNPNDVIAPSSRILATVNARAADLSAEIDRQVSSGGFVDGDISFVYVGVNDIAAQFARYPATGEPAITAEIVAAGLAEATAVNRLADLGTKVVVVTIPDMGLSPLAGGRNTDNSALLSRLSTAYNTALRANIYNDGRRIGLALLDEYIQSVSSAADRGLSGVTFTDAKDAACAVTLPSCTSQTLVSNASATAWLWADNTHLSAGGQNSLGSLASSRATNNPF